ncbi:MAG: hypothetical protein AAGL69_06730 [Pseudomonadota bacterium]
MTRRATLFHLLGDVAHGAVLKGLALSARLVFLLTVATGLADGELGSYVYLSSMAALLGRIGGLGLEEQLPLEIRGRRPTASRWLRTAEILFVLGLFLFGGALMSRHPVLLVGALTIAYITTSYLAGALRTIRITGSERLRDLHWILFVAMAILLPARNAEQLILLMILALLSVQALEVVLSRVQRVIAEGRRLPSWSNFVDLVKLSWRKLVAAAAVLAIVRALVLWPEWLRMDIDLDEIAYALLIGEAFWQTLMVLVHRRYAAYCRLDKAELAEGIRSDLSRVGPMVGLYGLLVSAGAALIGQLDITIAGFNSWWLVAQMVGFFTAVSWYLMLRYVVWVIRDFDWRLAGLELVLIVSQAVVVITMPVAYWPGGACIVAIACLIGARLVAHSALSLQTSAPDSAGSRRVS